MLKRLLLSLLAVAGILGAAHAVNITGTVSISQNAVDSVGFTQYSTTDGITATASGTQATSVLLTSAVNRVATVATNNDSVKLPACIAGAQSAGMANTIGLMLYVINASANTLYVFPNTGDSINAVAANGAYTGMTTGKTSAFICATAGKWYTILGS